MFYRICYRLCLYCFILIPLLLLFLQGMFVFQHSTLVPVTAVNISPLTPDSISHFALGATHTENDVDGAASSQVARSAESLLQSSLKYQNQHIMGWGVDDPEPRSGVYKWKSLDERVRLMRRTHAQKILTLCCAPGWMRPAGHQNEWDDLETAPAPEHVRDFANLVLKVVLRYPDVHYFQVWNELKGMWSDSPGATPGISDANRWDYERYTILYNTVYDAIKKVRPDAQVGGPYVVMLSNGDSTHMSNPGPTYSWGTLDQRPLDVLLFWLVHKHGADFITIDGNSSNDDMIWRTDPFSAAQKFVDIANWIYRQTPESTYLPLWWAEWYVNVPEQHQKDLNYYNALMASAEIYTLRSKVALVLTWEPQGDLNGYSAPEGLWTDTRNTSGGKPTPYAEIAHAFSTYFTPGTPLYKVISSNSSVTVLASLAKTMLVNRLSIEQEVVVNGSIFTMQPYQVLVVNTF